MNRRQFLLTTAASTFALAAGAAEPERRLRVGVIGHTGHGDYGHGLDTVWLKVPETEIVAVADADPAGLAKTLAKLKVEKGFADYRQMLAEMKPDIVAVAPRHIDEHRDMMLAAIEAGARGIYVEKPFCRSLAEADEIMGAAAKAGAKIAIGHRNRYHPALPVVGQFVKDGGIGRLLEVRCRGKEDQRGGALDLWVLGSHLVNLAVYFTGQPVAATGTLFSNGKPVVKGDLKEGAEGVGLLGGNELHARFETEHGVPIFFDSIANAGSKATGFGLQLVGTKGVVQLRIDEQPLAHWLPGNPFTPNNEPRTWSAITSAGPGQPEPIADIKDQVGLHILPVRDLIASIRENRAPLCSADDGRLTIEMITAIFESHRLNGQRVAFPVTAKGNPLASLA